MSDDPAERAAERIATALFVSDPGIKQALADTIRAEYAELMPCGHQRACSREHERVEHQNCDIVNCDICDGGLFICKYCSKAEIELDEPCICTACEREAALERP